MIVYLKMSVALSVVTHNCTKCFLLESDFELISIVDVIVVVVELWPIYDTQCCLTS